MLPVWEYIVTTAHAVVSHLCFLAAGRGHPKEQQNAFSVRLVAKTKAIINLLRSPRHCHKIPRVRLQNLPSTTMFLHAHYSNISISRTMHLLPNEPQATKKQAANTRIALSTNIWWGAVNFACFLAHLSIWWLLLMSDRLCVCVSRHIYLLKN